MNFCVIGTINNDHTIYLDRSEGRGLGGIFYTILMLRHVMDQSDKIFPVCNLGDDIFDQVIAELTALGKIGTDFIYKIKQKNTAVRLVYRDREQRDEYISNLMPPLKLEQLLAPKNMDGYLVNFITGKEMSLTTFVQFCRRIEVPIFMDFHSLSLGIAEDGKRFYHYRDDWKKWVSEVDVLQLNEKEAANLMRNDSPSIVEISEFARTLIRERLKIVNITLGSKGSILAWQKNGARAAKLIPAFPVKNVVDVTGSGDAFMAGFICKFMKSNDPEKAAEFANRVAGLKCTRKGAEGIRELATDAM
ncbi:MAG: carbohydrate kinase family protein [Calditrichaeota bacterium]|nr:carbohydrate kinase family protein [Calditrichota bacterium]